MAIGTVYIYRHTFTRLSLFIQRIAANTRISFMSLSYIFVADNVHLSFFAFTRGGFRILQRRVSNPSERGTGGRASKAPRGWRLGRGLPRKFLYFLYQNGEFLCIPGDIY